MSKTNPTAPPSGKAQLDTRVPPGLRPGNNSVDVTVTKTASQDAIEKLIAGIEEMLARCDEEPFATFIGQARLELWLDLAKKGAK